MPKKQIEDIFCKKTKQTKFREPKTKIIIDTREKNSLIATFLYKKDFPPKFEHLEIADYLIQGEKTIAIERKTFSDFISSMINKRLIKQLNAIQKYENPMLLIESREEIENKNLEKATRGMILSILTEFKIPIIFTQDSEDTAEFLISLAKRMEKPKSPISLRHSPSSMNFQETKQFILEGFPGIGPTIAKKLLEKYKTLENIFNASKEELSEIPRFHEDKINKFKKLLEN